MEWTMEVVGSYFIQERKIEIRLKAKGFLGERATMVPLPPTILVQYTHSVWSCSLSSSSSASSHLPGYVDVIESPSFPGTLKERHFIRSFSLGSCSWWGSMYGRQKEDMWTCIVYEGSPWNPEGPLRRLSRSFCSSLWIAQWEVQDSGRTVEWGKLTGRDGTRAKEPMHAMRATDIHIHSLHRSFPCASPSSSSFQSMWRWRSHTAHGNKEQAPV